MQSRPASLRAMVLLATTSFPTACGTWGELSQIALGTALYRASEFPFEAGKPVELVSAHKCLMKAQNASASCIGSIPLHKWVILVDSTLLSPK